MGFEPMTTGFAGDNKELFSVIYGDIGHSKSLRGIDGNLRHGLKWVGVLVRLELVDHQYQISFSVEQSKVSSEITQWRTLIDARSRRMGQWLFTGSQEAPLMHGITESMAGRAAILQLLPFSVWETSKVSLLYGALVNREFYIRVRTAH